MPAPRHSVCAARAANQAAVDSDPVADVLTARTVTACRDHGVGTLVIVSGVAANARLRELAAQRCRYGNPPADTAAAVVY